MAGYDEKQLDKLISRTYKKIKEEVEPAPVHEIWAKLERRLPEYVEKETGGVSQKLFRFGKFSFRKRWQFMLTRIAAALFGFAVLTGAFAVVFPAQAKNMSNYFLNIVEITLPDNIKNIQMSFIPELREDAKVPPPPTEDLMQEGEISKKTAMHSKDVDNVDAGAGVSLRAAPAEDENSSEMTVFNNDMLGVTALEKYAESQGTACEELPVPEEEKVSLQEVIKRAPFKIKVPGYLPGELVLEEVLFRSLNPENTTAEVILYYSSSSKEEGSKEEDYEFLRIRQQNVIGGYALSTGFSGDGAETCDVEINGDKGKLISFDYGFTTLFWVDESNRIVINMDGKIASEEVLKVANSMEPQAGD